LRDVDICSVIDFCHVSAKRRNEMRSMRPGFPTSLFIGLRETVKVDLRFFAPLRMTEEDPWKSFAYSGTLGKSLRFVPV